MLLLDSLLLQESDEQSGTPFFCVYGEFFFWGKNVWGVYIERRVKEDFNQPIHGWWTWPLGLSLNQHVTVEF